MFIKINVMSIRRKIGRVVLNILPVSAHQASVELLNKRQRFAAAKALRLDGLPGLEHDDFDHV